MGDRRRRPGRHRGRVAHPELELVGCWVHSADKVGRDAGELAGIDPIGVPATTTSTRCCASTPTASSTRRCWPTPAMVGRMLALGQERRHARSAGSTRGARRRRRARGGVPREGGVTLHGTGIHPGGITERFPLMVSALSSASRHVRAEEFSDIRTYAAPDVVRDIMLFGSHARGGGRRARWSKSSAPGSASRSTWSPTSSGFALDAEQTHAATRWPWRPTPIDSPIGVIEPGLVAAQRFTLGGARSTASRSITVARELVDGRGATSIRPWTFGPEGERFEVEVDGRPAGASDVPRPAPAVDRGGARPEPGHRRHRHALRERRSPTSARAAARHQDLPRPPAHRRSRRAGTCG